VSGLINDRPLTMAKSKRLSSRGPPWGGHQPLCGANRPCGGVPARCRTNPRTDRGHQASSRMR